MPMHVQGCAQLELAPIGNKWKWVMEVPRSWMSRPWWIYNIKMKRWGIRGTGLGHSLSVRPGGQGDAKQSTGWLGRAHTESTLLSVLSQVGTLYKQLARLLSQITEAAGKSLNGGRVGYSNLCFSWI